MLLAGSGKGLLANNASSADIFTKAFDARGINDLSQYSQHRGVPCVISLLVDIVDKKSGE